MIIKQGNLLEVFASGTLDAIAHQVNCFNTGAGIAAIINNEYPIVKRKEEELHKILVNPIDRYGFVLPVETYNGLVFNMYSQYQQGGVKNNDMDNFERRCYMLEHCLDHINMLYPSLKIAFPLVASGLAADKTRKGKMTDLEYFLRYIQPIFDSFNNNNWVIYYL